MREKRVVVAIVHKPPDQLLITWNAAWGGSARAQSR
jgi:hypothetical protein